MALSKTEKIVGLGLGGAALAGIGYVAYRDYQTQQAGGTAGTTTPANKYAGPSGFTTYPNLYKIATTQYPNGVAGVQGRYWVVLTHLPSKNGHPVIGLAEFVGPTLYRVYPQENYDNSNPPNGTILGGQRG